MSAIADLIVAFEEFAEAQNMEPLAVLAVMNANRAYFVETQDQWIPDDPFFGLLEGCAEQIAGAVSEVLATPKSDAVFVLEEFNSISPDTLRRWLGEDD